MKPSKTHNLRIAHMMAFATAALGSVSQAWAGVFLPDGVAPEAVSPAPSVVVLGAEPVVCVAVSTGRQAIDMTEKIISAHNRAYSFAKDNGLKLGRGALEISARYEEPDGSWVTDACRSVQAHPGRSFPNALDIKVYQVAGGRAVQALHRGDHGTIKETIDKVEAYIELRALQRVGPLVEYHFNHKPPEEIEQQISVVTVYVKW